MATRGKSISVKIATPKIIKALEATLAKLESDYSTQEAKEAKFTKAQEKWQKEITAFAIKNFTKAENIRVNFRSWNGTLNIDYDLTNLTDKDLSAQPERDYKAISTGEYRNKKQEIANAIRILNMTDEETVNTSTYNAVAQYL